MAAAANKQEHQGHQGPSPKAQDVKKLNLFMRKVYSNGGAPALDFKPPDVNEPTPAHTQLSNYQTNSSNESLIDIQNTEAA
ncbi:hypothetical protein UY3_04840 [Chelonia mydas]|uniref:Uncharacterized protein n=1 Tax=Chelonia mydas TaxID=8469 RepID=M7C0R9_CHEMY|nr:hypothetical protein UY3_04840 [Chelonia mydas]